MIWLAVLIIMLIMSAFSDYFKKSVSSRLWRTSLFFMAIVAGFRNMGGADYLIYKNHFYGKEEGHFEIGYEILVKFFNLFGLNYETFVFTVSFTCLIVLANFIKKFSTKPNLSLFIYVGAYFIYYNLIATRQLIALSFFLVGLSYLINRQDWKFVGMVIFGTLFHTSVLVSILGIILIRFFKISIVIVLLLLTVFYFTRFDLTAVIVFISKYGLSFIESRMVYGYLLPDRVFPLTTFVRVIFTYALMLNFYRKEGLIDEKIKVVFGFYTMFFILFLIFNRYDIMMRIWVYFEVVSIILIPYVISSYRNNLVKLTIFLFYIGFYSLSFFNNINSFDGGDLTRLNLIFLPDEYL